ARGRLIVALIDAGILHRFDEEDLVVTAEDEERTDDLVAGVAAGEDLGGDAVREGSAELDARLVEHVELLHRAAVRLQADPTDMQADGDVAQASAVVFVADGYPGADEATWSAVGRVTRRLLGALGADEALEDEIRTQAGVLRHLLDPCVLTAPTAVPGSEAEESVYELPEWLPEQRADLSVLLDEAGIPHSWEGGDLVVPEAREDDVEALFDRVGGVREDEDDGVDRYHALEELFAAADRFVNDPDSKSKAADVVRAVSAADGPTPLGLDDAQWWAIRTRALTLADALESDEHLEVAFGEATTLRDLLRPIV
ncbi:MAG TPA: hypothetical protein VKV25_03740, partial [Acidimicrobiales bacterium]|nr:hypothetical protein [Acidimicrobiales bacterium]